MQWLLESVPGGSVSAGSRSSASEPGSSASEPGTHPPSPHPRELALGARLEPAQLPTGHRDAASQKGPRAGLPQANAWSNRLRLALAAQNSRSSPTPTCISHQKPQLKGDLEAPSGPKAHGPLAPLLRFPKSYAKGRPTRKSALSSCRISPTEAPHLQQNIWPGGQGAPGGEEVTLERWQ